MFYPNLIESIIDRVHSNNPRMSYDDMAAVPTSVFNAACSFVRACCVSEFYSLEYESTQDADITLANLDQLVVFIDERGKAR